MYMCGYESNYIFPVTVIVALTSRTNVKNTFRQYTLVFGTGVETHYKIFRLCINKN